MSDADRYARQVRFAPIGVAGQALIRRARVLVVGVGALGTVWAEGLCRAGVGTLVLVDRDIVELSNLQRQVLFTDRDATEHRAKALAAKEALAKINPEVTVEAHATDVTPGTLPALAQGCDLIADGTDNFQTRLLINDYAVKHGVPWVYTAAVAAEGCVMPVLPGDSACLACVLEALPAAGETDTCETAGVIGPAVLLAAGAALAETLKLLSGNAEAVRRALVFFDCWRGETHAVGTARPRPSCPVCGADAAARPADERFRYLDGDALGSRTMRLCGRDTVQIAAAEGAGGLDLLALAERQPPEVEVRASAAVVRLRLPHAARGDGDDGGDSDGGPVVLTCFADGRVLVHGTSDPARARGLVARYVGA